MRVALCKTSRYTLPPFHVRLQRIFDPGLRLTADQKLLLLYYVCYRADNQTGATDVTVARVARECSLSRRTVQRALRKLSAMGLLQRQRRIGGPNRTKAACEMTLPHIVPDPEQQADGGADASGSRTPRATETHPVRQPDAQSSSLIQESIQIKSSKPEDVIPLLWKEISKTATGVSERIWQWAATRILGRAKTPPRDPAAFLRRSWPRFLAAFDDEVVEWLEEEALTLLPHESLADAADHLKSRAAEHDLPYDAPSIDHAIERATRRLEKHLRLKSEITVGQASLYRPRLAT